MTNELSKHDRRIDKFIELEERKSLIADLYFVQHKTMQQVAAILGISTDTVSADIRRIKDDLANKRLDRLQGYLHIELAKLDKVEREAWAAWERSIGKSVKKIKKEHSSGDWTEEIVEETLVGDPRFLNQVQSAIDRRIRLLGLDAPQEILVNTMEGKLTKLIQDGKVTFTMLLNDIGIDQARRYFNLAGVRIPDIVEGEYAEKIDDNYVSTEIYHLKNKNTVEIATDYDNYIDQLKEEEQGEEIDW